MVDEKRARLVDLLLERGMVPGPKAPPPRPAPPPAPPLAVGNGKAGSHLKAMTTSIGVPACQSCAADAAEMDAKGPAWCREHLAELVARIEPRAKQLGWVAKAKAAALALSQGLPLSVRGLVEEAIRRAEGAIE